MHAVPHIDGLLLASALVVLGFWLAVLVAALLWRNHRGTR